MVTTIHCNRTIISGASGLASDWDNGENNVNEIVNPTYQDLQGHSLGAEGRGAVRGIRIRNFEPSGWWVSGFQQLRMIIDDKIIASGTLQIPYDTVRGQYVNLGMFTLGADYHEEYWFSGLSACCDCAMLVNQQRVAFHKNFRLQARWIWHSGWNNGFNVDVWYELKE